MCQNHGEILYLYEGGWAEMLVIYRANSPLQQWKGDTYCGMPGPPCLSVLLMFPSIDEEICLERLESYTCSFCGLVHVTG